MVVPEEKIWDIPIKLDSLLGVGIFLKTDASNSSKAFTRVICNCSTSPNTTVENGIFQHMYLFSKSQYEYMINVLKFILPRPIVFLVVNLKHLAIGSDDNICNSMTEDQRHCALQFDQLKVTDIGDNNTPAYAS